MKTRSQSLLKLSVLKQRVTTSDCYSGVGEFFRRETRAWHFCHLWLPELPGIVTEETGLSRECQRRRWEDHLVNT